MKHLPKRPHRQGGNARLVKSLYENVIAQFKYKLERKEKFGDFPSGLFDYVTDRVTELLSSPETLHRVTQNSTNQTQNQVPVEDQPKCKYQEPVKTLGAYQSPCDDQDDCEDDFQIFNRVRNCPKESQQLSQTKPNTEGSEPSPQSNIDDIDPTELQERQNIISQVTQQIDICFMGAFLSGKKKYSYKTGKTKVVIDDVVVRVDNKEMFFSKIICELASVRPEDIPL